MGSTDYTRRAMAAYFRTGGTAQRSSGSGRCRAVDGREYIHLHSTAGTLAVYRILPAGRLKRLKRWPAEIGEVA